MPRKYLKRKPRVPKIQRIQFDIAKIDRAIKGVSLRISMCERVVSENYMPSFHHAGLGEVEEAVKEQAAAGLELEEARKRLAYLERKKAVLQRMLNQ